MSSDNPDTRTRILQAALDLLETHQGKGVRMTDIAKRANLTRQAVYLHFSNRSELLIAVTLYMDGLKGSDARLAASRGAKTGLERLDAFIEAWGGYIPDIYGVAKALLAMRDTDEEAATAWDKRMLDMREGCEAAINALMADGKLRPEHSAEHATDILWTMLSVRNWEQMTMVCGWSQADYIATQKAMARRLFVTDGA